MTARVFLLPDAQHDLDEQVVYIGERNYPAAERFEAAVKGALANPAEMPGMGALRGFPNKLGRSAIMAGGGI